MTRQGYFFCDRCEELASGPRCEHCNAEAPTVRWIHVAIHHPRPAPVQGEQPGVLRIGPVSVARGRELWLKLHRDLKL